MGRRLFLSQISASSVTQICQVGSCELVEDEDAHKEGQTVSLQRMRRVTLVDMPGFGDTQLSAEQIHAEIAKCVSLTAPGPHAFLLVVPIGRYTDSENQAVLELAKIFGEDAVHHHTLVLFTRGDDLEGLAIDEYLKETAPAGLQVLIDRCGGRYHVLNNKDTSNSLQVKELLLKVKKMATKTKEGFYTNAMFLEAEAAIRAEQNRLLRGEDRCNSKEEQDQTAKRRKCDLESDGDTQGIRRSELERGSADHFRVERWTEEKSSSACSLLTDGAERLRDHFRGRRRAFSKQPSLSCMRMEAALSPKVLDRIKVLVAAGVTGMAVGVVFGAAAPLAAAVGASLVGNSVGFAAGQFAGMSVAGGTGVGEAVGTIVAAASGKTALALGAATGGVLGGSVGAIAGAEAASPQEGALDALVQVSVIGASAVGLAAGVGGTLGAGAALGAALDGAAFSTAALSSGESVSTLSAGTANVSAVQSNLASTVGEHALTMVASRALEPQGTVAATTRILNAVAEISKAAAGIALAGGLVVKVVKEKVRCGTGTSESTYTEKKSYEIHWNK